MARLPRNNMGAIPRNQRPPTIGGLFDITPRNQDKEKITLEKLTSFTIINKYRYYLHWSINNI